jgi:hypothetical protein
MALITVPCATALACDNYDDCGKIQFLLRLGCFLKADTVSERNVCVVVI